MDLKLCWFCTEFTVLVSIVWELWQYECLTMFRTNTNVRLSNEHSNVQTFVDAIIMHAETILACTLFVYNNYYSIISSGSRCCSE